MDKIIKPRDENNKSYTFRYSDYDLDKGEYSLIDDGDYNIQIKCLCNSNYILDLSQCSNIINKRNRVLLVRTWVKPIKVEEHNCKNCHEDYSLFFENFRNLFRSIFNEEYGELKHSCLNLPKYENILDNYAEEETYKKVCPVDGCNGGKIDISVASKRIVECNNCNGTGYVEE